MQTPLELRGSSAGEPNGWRAALDHAQQQRARLAVAPAHGDRAHELFLLDLEITRRAAALGETATLQAAVTSAAAWGAAAALCEFFTRGTVSVRVPHQPEARVPAGGGKLLPPEWFAATACACLSRDPNALMILTQPQLLESVITKTNARNERVGREAFWAPYCELLAGIIRKERISPERIEACREALLVSDRGYIDPESIEAEKVPALDLMAAIAAADVSQWSALVRAAIDRFHAYYSQPTWAHLEMGMLPLTVAALCAVAQDRHGKVAYLDSPYLPTALFQRRGDLPGSDISYAFPRMHSRDAREIHWFLDLEGVPRSGRQHHLVEQDGDLVAQYQLTGGAIGPHASAEFVLDDGEVPLLMDAGELLLASDLHARQADARPSGKLQDLQAQRGHLTEAIDALDEVMRLLPPKFHSARGRAVWEAEPGRFDADRLRAVRNTYLRILTDVDARLRNTRNAES